MLLVLYLELIYATVWSSFVKFWLIVNVLCVFNMLLIESEQTKVYVSRFDFLL